MTIDVTKYTNHESYNTLNSDNDITIIELAQEVDLTTYTPACLAKTSDTTAFDGKSALVYGGLTRTFLIIICHCDLAQVGAPHPTEAHPHLTNCWRWPSL